MKRSRVHVLTFIIQIIEESYKLYENNDCSIKLKEFSDYFTFEIISENKDLKIKK